MDNFLGGLMIVVLLGFFAILSQWILNAIDPGFAANDERVRFIVLCENKGGEKEGSYCIRNNEIIKINMRDLDHEDS